MINALLTMLLFGFFWLCLAPGIALPMRVEWLTVLGAAGLIIARFAPESARGALAVRRLTLSRYEPAHLLIAVSLSMCAAVSLWLSPQQGLRIERLGADDAIEQSEDILLDEFTLQPSLVDDGWIEPAPDRLRVTASFYTDRALHSVMLFASHGGAVWNIDGRLAAWQEQSESNRFLVLPLELEAGAHQVECVIDGAAPFPRVAVSATRSGTTGFTPVAGIHPGLHPLAWREVIFAGWLGAALGVLAFFFAAPSLNAIAAPFFAHPITRFAASVTVAAIALIALPHPLPHHEALSGAIRYEADEAAFGVMAQRLLDGQAPPLFHYGQVYQGTWEAWPLAVLIHFLGDPALALKVLPMIWGIIFIITTIYCYFEFFSTRSSLFALVFFCVVGAHFGWILSKAWFGYSFSLAAGSILMSIGLRAYQRNEFSALSALAWGALSAATLYELPISLPFVAASGVLIVHPLFVSWRKSRSVAFSQRIAALAGSRRLRPYLLAGLTLAAGLFPYWAPIDPGSARAAEFLRQGRALPEARVAGERPLVDRFIGECLPVLLGSRTPYNQQSDLRQAKLAYIPSILFLISLAWIPFAGFAQKTGNLIGDKLIRLTLFCMGVFTILLVSYSPFGVWPWYALPLYWLSPVLFFSLLRSAWRLSPSLSIGLCGLLFVSWMSTASFSSPRMQNPSSLSQDGMLVPTRFNQVKKLVKEKGIEFLLCDQGFDISPNDAGRDWIGECLTFDSNGSVTGSDRLSRRFPEDAWRAIRSNAVGYLYRQGFYYNNPSLESPERYLPMNMDVLKSLFGKECLDYHAYTLDDYELFLPSEKMISMEKSTWKLESNNPTFLDAAADNNISPRGYNRNTYWSSGYIPSDGGYLRITFPEPKPFSRVVLFHGTKANDYLHENQAFCLTEGGEWYEVGSLKYYRAYRSSILTTDKPVVSRSIEIRFTPPEDNSWLTVFELWVF
ncbi:MAG: hypothetical protein GC154_08125 [bacterium]|nr:hypothetical protein [bacterium]